MPLGHHNRTSRSIATVAVLALVGTLSWFAVGMGAYASTTRNPETGTTLPASASSTAAQSLAASALKAAQTDLPSVHATGFTPQPLGQPFATRFASFQPVPFDVMPGWSSDNLLESLNVFRRSCQVLASKAAWAATCAALDNTTADSSDSARQFFQTHFNAYQVRNLDEDPTGLITGYYEPQLNGRDHREGAFVYPVYARPDDMYRLDSRKVTGAASQWFVKDGESLKAVAAGTSGAREYWMALGDDLPDMADKRYRVRIDGRTIRPYWTRQQIDQRGVDAPVIAWVDDAWALYSMQIQGTGRIRMDDGHIIRLAYAGQNGQPFLPNASSHDTALLADAIKTRGLGPAPGTADGTTTDQSVAAIIARLQGNAPPASNRPRAPNYPHAQLEHNDQGEHDDSVQAIIDRFQGSVPANQAQAHVSTPPPAGTTVPNKASDPQVQAMIAVLLGKAPPPTGGGSQPIVPHTDQGIPEPATDNDIKRVTTGVGDPSYVFFREVPASLSGPPGALGVPLTPGRSLAVDPRTTPLGAPVFVETARPKADGDIRRLMLAQDTGGAIRGSVRGDFFWGAGPQAGSMASAMNASGRMWLLLPKQLQLGALNPRVRTRSLGNIASAPDCVIPDGEFCVE